MRLSKLMKSKATPFLLILLGFIVLVLFGQPIFAGACLVIGITMIINWFLPEEEWEKR